MEGNVKEILSQMFGDESAANEFIDNFTKKLEDAEQERYALQRQLEQKEAMERLYLEEIDMLKKESEKRQQEICDAQLQSENVAAANKKKVWSSQQEMDDLRLQNQKEANEVKRLQTQVSELQQQLSSQQNQLNETCSDEIAELFSQMATLQEEKCSMAEELALTQEKFQQKECHHQQLQRQLESSVEETDQARKENNVYKESLKDSRENIQELTCQLQVLKAETHNQRGNSLFGELDDRRVKAEKAAVSLRVKYDALVHQHTLTCRHLQNLKCEISNSVANMDVGSNADRERIDRLESQLSAALGMNSKLNGKIIQTNRLLQDTSQKLHMAISDGVSKVLKTSGGVSSQARLMQLLNGQLEEKSKKVEELECDLNVARLTLTAETDKVVAANNKFHQAVRALSESTRTEKSLEIQLTALQSKYEPEAVKEKKIRKFKVIRESITSNPLEESTKLAENNDVHDSQNTEVKTTETSKKPTAPTNNKENAECKVQ